MYLERVSRVSIEIETLDVAPVEATDEGDHDRFKHYVKKGDDVKGYAMGEPIQALCGKLWVPSKSYDKYPLCQSCVEVARGLGFTVGGK